MRPERISEIFVKNLLDVLPSWHSKLVRPFRDTLNRQMSLETYYCLKTIKRCGAVTMSELARQLKVPKQQVTKLVDKLCEHGFVERVCGEDDRRLIRIGLTPRAVRYLDEYCLKNTAFLESVEERLTEDELERLNGALRVLGELLPKLK